MGKLVPTLDNVGQAGVQCKNYLSRVGIGILGLAAPCEHCYSGSLIV
jgi:hypothetical protein